MREGINWEELWVLKEAMSHWNGACRNGLRYGGRVRESRREPIKPVDKVGPRNKGV